MVQSEMPPNAPAKMELQKLTVLLKAAFFSVLPLVYQSTPQQKLYTIWRATENGAGSYSVVLPNAVSIWDPFVDGLQQGMFNEILTYLWDHGTPRVTFTGPDPNKKAWENWALNQVIRPPLVQWLEDMFIMNACNQNEPLSWPVATDIAMEELALMQARLLCEDAVFVTGYFFLPGFGLPEGLSCVTLGEAISIRDLSQNEKHYLLSKSAFYLLWDDLFGMMPQEVLCEIKIWVSRSEMTTISDRITEKLNILRLALTLVQPNQWRNSEGVVLVDTQSANSYRSTSRLLRRRSSQWAGFQAVEDVLDRLRKHVEALERVSTIQPELKSALWRFGRACSADMPRDQLIEAVIGMESLLVEGSGESTYRFSLHAASILPVLDGGEMQLIKQLKHLYDQRSGGVHGGRRATILDDDVNDAVVKFAGVIKGIMDLDADNKLPVAKTIAKSVEKLVLTRATHYNVEYE